MGLEFFATMRLNLISGTDLTITKAGADGVSFITTYNPGQTWEGIINTVRLKAKKTDTLEVFYSKQ